MRLGKRKINEGTLSVSFQLHLITWGLFCFFSKEMEMYQTTFGVRGGNEKEKQSRTELSLEVNWNQMYCSYRRRVVLLSHPVLDNIALKMTKASIHKNKYFLCRKVGNHSPASLLLQPSSLFWWCFFGTVDTAADFQTFTLIKTWPWCETRFILRLHSF